MQEFQGKQQDTIHRQQTTVSISAYAPSVNAYSF